jgi:hypothetical protein
VTKKGRTLVVAFAALSVSFITIPRSASAQTPRDSERAEKLFNEAISLVRSGNYAEACPRFEESQRLDPGLGTQLNLALCLEKAGKLGSAWRNFMAVRRLAHASGKKGREEEAQRKLDALGRQVDHLVVTARDADVTVKIDGEQVDRESWSFYAIDSGEHIVEATAPAKKSWNSRVVVERRTGGTEGTAVVVEVPALEAVVEPARAVTLAEEPSNTKRTFGLVIGGIGIVGLAGAAVTGVMLLKADSTVEQRCTPTCIDEDSRDALSTGKTLLPINAAAWGVGLVGLGVGSFLVLTSGTKKPSAARLTPLFRQDAGGMSFAARF